MTNTLKKDKKRKMLVLTFGALIYALLFALGSQIEQSGSTAFSQTLLRFTAAFPAALFLLWVIFEKCRFQAKEKHEKPFCGVLKAGAFLLLCDLPMFLIEYPGSFAYDSYQQALQVSTGEYSTFHPLLYTMLLRAGIAAYSWLQSLEKCMALVIVIQMVLTALCFALTCDSLARSCSPRAARWALAAFAFWPYHMVFSCNYMKDTLFSAFLTLFFALTLEELKAKRASFPRIGGEILCGALACLLRNNMIYAMLVWGMLLLFVKPPVRRIGFCALAACVVSMGVNAAMVSALHAAGGSMREMLSVPAQQLARAYRLSPESFDEEDRRLMDVYIEEQRYLKYDPTIADPVKDKINEDAIRADRSGALAFWLRIGKRCPGVYLDAFLNTALPMLYPYQRYSATPDYIETGITEKSIAAPFGQDEPVQPSRFSAIRSWLDAHVWATGAADIPLLRWVFNAGVVIWLMGLCVLHAMYAGRWKRFAVLLLPVLLWGTYLLGPVVQGRYVYPFVCLLPLMLAVSRTKEE